MDELKCMALFHNEKNRPKTPPRFRVRTVKLAHQATLPITVTSPTLSITSTLPTTITTIASSVPVRELIAPRKSPECENINTSLFAKGRNIEIIVATQHDMVSGSPKWMVDLKPVLFAMVIQSF